MKASQYSLSIAGSTKNGAIDSERLIEEVKTSPDIGKALASVDTKGDECLLRFTDELTPGEKAALLALVLAHTGEPALPTDRVDTHAVAVKDAPEYSGADFEVIADMRAVVDSGGAPLLVQFAGAFVLQDGDSWDVAIFLDGAIVPASQLHVQAVGIFPLATHAVLTGLSRKAHTIEARWAVSLGAARAYSTQRSLACAQLL